MAFGKKFWSTLRDVGALALAPATAGLSLGLLAGGEKNREVAKQFGKEGFWGLLGEHVLGLEGETGGSLEGAPPQFDTLDKLISLRDRYAAASTGGGGYSEFFTGAGNRSGRGPFSGPQPKEAPSLVESAAGKPSGVARQRTTSVTRQKSRRFKETPLGIPPRGVF